MEEQQDLKALFQKKKALRAEVPFNKSLSVKLRYLSHRRHILMLDGSKGEDFGSSRKAVDVYDNDVYWKEIVKYVEGWNMTYGMIQDMTDVELPEDIDPASEVPCQPNNLFECFHEIKGFAAFVVTTITDRIQFDKERMEGEKKTSIDSPDSDSEST